MTKVQQLVHNYQRFVHLPWPTNIAGSQRVWFAVYPPTEERNVRAQISEFEIATRDAHHKWSLIDLTNIPAIFISEHGYRESYFNEPETVSSIEDDLKDYIVSFLRTEFKSPDNDENTVVAIMGTGALFGFTHISSIISAIDTTIKGRLLVFFPGVYEKNQYRFMDARDGFNYMAIPITCDEGNLI